MADEQNTTEWKEELEVSGEVETVGIGKKPNEYQEVPGGKFKEGNPGGGRPPLTEEDRLKKKATEEYINEYKERLAEALPLISPALIKKAKQGDVQAIKEVNDRVMGKAPQTMDVKITEKKLLLD